MSLQSTWTLVNDQIFRGRLAAAMYKAAENILNEGADETTDRFKLAEMVRTDAMMKVDWFTWKVASNPSVAVASEVGQENVPDGDIEYVIASVWDAVAEIYVPAPVPMGGTSIPIVGSMPPGQGLKPVADPVTVLA